MTVRQILTVCVLSRSEADRDANAAWNILSCGVKKRLGAGRSESTSPEIFDFWRAKESLCDSLTPVETALPVDTPVSAKRVMEAGSPALSERVSASRAG